jgi:chemotaxis protein histidine kinase CheA
MSNPVQKTAQMISPDAYPQMMGKQQGARAMQSLRSAQTLDRAANVMEASVPHLKMAILEYVAGMEEAGADMRKLFDKVHEIRGFAATAGLVTTGRIAEILCRYMDDMERMGQALDGHLVTLHVSAIALGAGGAGRPQAGANPPLTL